MYLRYKEGVYDLKSVVITLSTVTYAIKSRKLLAKNGIRSKLIKVNTGLYGKGCAYGIEISSDKYLDSIMILRRENIAYQIKSDIK